MNADAFSQPSANIGFDGELAFKVGDGLFRKIRVSAPSSTLAPDGLGPLYNARSCQRCHLKDGRGHPPESGAEDAVSMFLRVSVPAGDAAMTETETYPAALGDPAPRTRPHPVYGEQMQDVAPPGQAPEYALAVPYAEIAVPLSGGEAAHLRAPSYEAAALGCGPLGADAMLSPRVIPQMIGLGLLEAIDPADIPAAEDPDDADGDGISGRAQIVWSVEFERPMLGRFGLKAGAPTIRHQSAAAFSGDIGISSPLFPAPGGDCTEAQPACHTPKFVAQRLADQPAQSFQLIWPHSDLLLHDMGEGLADNRPEGRATGAE